MMNFVKNRNMLRALPLHYLAGILILCLFNACGGTDHEIAKGLIIPRNVENVSVEKMPNDSMFVYFTGEMTYPAEEFIEELRQKLQELGLNGPLDENPLSIGSPANEWHEYFDKNSNKNVANMQIFFLDDDMNLIWYDFRYNWIGRSEVPDSTTLHVHGYLLSPQMVQQYLGLEEALKEISL